MNVPSGQGHARAVLAAKTFAPTVALLALIMVWTGQCPGQQTPSSPPLDAGRLVEAIMEARSNISPTPGLDAETMHKALSAFIRQFDPYGDFLSREDRQALTSSSRGQYGGIGMEVLLTREGAFLCMPRPDGPAQRGGVLYKDRLLAVNGHPIDSLGLEHVAALLRGQPGSVARLTLASNGGNHEVAIPRELVDGATVSIQMNARGNLLRISRFTPSTQHELLENLRRLPPETRTLVIDLRGNPGGDLQAALDAAELFLDSGAVLIRQKSRAGERTPRAKGSPVFKGRLFLWQDELTASAAEVFLAAMNDNRRATSIGKQSFGKGKSQKLVEFLDGSAALLTYAELLTPLGDRFDRIGLAPTRPLPENEGGEEAYWALSTPLPGAQSPPEAPWW